VTGSITDYLPKTRRKEVDGVQRFWLSLVDRVDLSHLDEVSRAKAELLYDILNSVRSCKAAIDKSGFVGNTLDDLDERLCGQLAVIICPEMVEPDRWGGEGRYGELKKNG
jgi:hypothetical protein